MYEEKVIRFSSGKRQNSWIASLNEEILEEAMICFRYLKVEMTAKRITEAEVSHMLGEGSNAWVH